MSIFPNWLGVEIYDGVTKSEYIEAIELEFIDDSLVLELNETSLELSLDSSELILTIDDDELILEVTCLT